jgi:hypothetical protein
MSYEHTQRSPLPWLLLLPIVGLAVLAWSCRNEPPLVVVLIATGLVLVLAATMFRRMTVRDDGSHLAIRYGPLPVFRTRIAYADMSAVEKARSSVIDGWGIHWIPGRGVTYNLWGRDCVRLLVRGRIVRIGSDDVEGLVAFLRTKVEHA